MSGTPLTSAIEKESLRHLRLLAPGLDACAPPLDLAIRPTPVSHLPELAKTWRLASFHVKRDDLSHPAYGGSKVRTLEYVLGHARRLGCTGIATLGPHGSHQAVTLAILGRLHGFQTHAVLGPRLATPEIAHNDRVLPLYGMDVMRCETFTSAAFALFRLRLKSLIQKRLYWLPAGAKCALGVLGVVEGALELARSIKSGEQPMPDDVLVPSGTCATAAGLLLGFAIAGLPVRVVAVRIVPKVVSGPQKMRHLAESALRLLRQHGFRAPVHWGEPLWVDDQAGPQYGEDNAFSQQAAEDVRAAGCFRTEPTYTSKALGFLASGALAGRKVLFWTTYSAVDPRPDLFA